MPVLDFMYLFVQYLYKVSVPNTDDGTVFTSVAGIDKTITRKTH